jgi:putative flippase GtrA
MGWKSPLDAGAPVRPRVYRHPRGGNELRTFLRGQLTSLFTSALDFATLVGLVEWLGVHYVVATWCGTVVGSLSNFAINKSWTFDAGRDPVGPQLRRFALVQAGASALHTAGVWLLTRFAGLPYPASKLAIAVTVALLWNYPLNRRFVFAKLIPSPPASTGAPPGS